MSAEQNKEFIRQYLRAISGVKKTEALVDEYVADDSLKEHILQAELAFPEYELVAVEMIAEGDLVSVRGISRGVNSGPFQGMPPTGKEFNISIFLTYRIVDGKIVEHWMLTDTMALLQQLGIT